MNNNNYDIIIIGSGLGGGTLANFLAPTGKKILILERGDFLPVEKENWSPHAVFTKKRYQAKEIWEDGNGAPFNPGIHYCVGGNSKVFGAALLRFREQDFEELRHTEGISPEWPVKYDEFAPYYLKAEKMYHVHGLRGSDPTEPPEKSPYFYPPVQNEPRIQQLYDDLQKIGNNPFFLPMGLLLDENKRYQSPCIKCNTCDGFPCLVGAKADAHIISITPALKFQNVTLLTNTIVEKLETDFTGRSVNRVLAKQNNGEKISFSGDVVVLAAGAINSAALLLASRSDKHPNGLANSSDMVGRNYMCHNNSAVMMISTTPNPTIFAKTIGVNDYYFKAKDFDYPLGHIQMLGKTDAEMLIGDAPFFVPFSILKKIAAYSLDFWLTSEDLPDQNNRVLVTKEGKIILNYKENNLEGHRRLVCKLKEQLTKISGKILGFPKFIFLTKKIPLAGTAHQCGTIRFGKDSMSSVLDVNCKAHDLDNLYVVDSSFFVSSAATNPGLTIIANALRVGTIIKNKLSNLFSIKKNL